MSKLHQSEHRLFEDIEHIGDDTRLAMPKIPWWTVGVCLLGGLTAVILSLYWAHSPNDGSDAIQLHGPDVDRLTVGAPVMLGQVQIGEVGRIAVASGQQYAELTFQDEFKGQITSEHRFRIESLNRILPGNIGVRVLPPAVDLGLLTPAMNGPEFSVESTGLSRKFNPDSLLWVVAFSIFGCLMIGAAASRMIMPALKFCAWILVIVALVTALVKLEVFSMPDLQSVTDHGIEKFELSE